MIGFCQGKQAERLCPAAFAIVSCAMEAHVKSIVE